MTLDEFDPSAVMAIRERLEQVRGQGITIGFAIESGSRAWGFPSPDSDYDCRFIYIRPIGDHLTLKPVRDVIEFPIEGVIDTGGWDLRKALNLALAGNAVVNEWVCSPLVYEEVVGFRAELRTLLNSILEPQLVANHYVGLQRNQIHLLGGLDGEIKLKKLFYVIRPLVSLQWMEARDYKALPPMDIQSLLAESPVPNDAREAIERLIAVKAETREIGTGEIDGPLRTYLKSLIDHFNARKSAKPDNTVFRHDKAEQFYRDWVKRST